LGIYGQSYEFLKVEKTAIYVHHSNFLGQRFFTVVCM
jgi:hypothetical protein